jgi:signal transduction histidine kinase
MAEALEPGLQAEFDEERRRLIRRRTVLACILTLSIAPLYAVADAFVYPERFYTLVVGRLLCVLLTGSVLIVLRYPVGERHPDWLGLLLGLEIGFMVSGMPVLLLGYATPYFVGFMIVILAVALLMPWRTLHTVLLSAGLVTMYLVASLVHGHIQSPGMFLTNTSFILTASVVALVSIRAGAELHRREFRTRSALQGALGQKSELAARLEEQTKRLELVNQEMEDLLYVASHDLRAPLINVQGFTRELQLALEELRREPPTSPETRAVVRDIDESLGFILSAVSRMDSLIGLLLNLSRIATRTNPTETVPLAQMVDSIIDSFRYQLDQKQVTVVIGNLPEVMGDPVRLSQAISNLVDNAIKYMGDRPMRRIEIGANSVNGTCACYVRDSGSGIPPEKQESIFRLFHRLHNGSVPGEGIGLTMVRKIIEKHGGHVWVEAAPGEGSIFWFTLRAAHAASAHLGGEA